MSHFILGNTAIAKDVSKLIADRMADNAKAQMDLIQRLYAALNGADSGLRATKGSSLSNLSEQDQREIEGQVSENWERIGFSSLGEANQWLSGADIASQLVGVYCIFAVTKSQVAGIQINGLMGIR